MKLRALQIKVRKKKKIKGRKHAYFFLCFLPGLEFFKDTVPGEPHLEKKLTQDLGNDVVQSEISHLGEEQLSKARPSGGSLPGGVYGEHLPGLSFFDHHERTKEEEVKRMGLDKHLNHEALEAGMIATPKVEHSH